jgi:hypothetical protein
MRYDVLDMRYDVLDVRYDVLDVRYDVLDVRYDVLDVRYARCLKYSRFFLPFKHLLLLFIFSVKFIKPSRKM